MISYFTKMYQAVPALIQIYDAVGGTFVSTRGSTIKAVNKTYPGTSCLKYSEGMGRFSSGYQALSRSEVIVTGSPNKQLLDQFDANKYMVFHGTYAFMAQQEIDGLSHFDHVCVIGPRMQEALTNHGLESKLIMSGYLPFMGFPERNESRRMQFLSDLGLDPENPTLLYLPRGRPYGSWDVMAEILLRQLPKQYNLILRPHPSQSVTARLHDKFGFIRLQRLCRERGNAFLDLTTCKLSTLFSVADLVISDGASSPEESLFYDLPQVFVESEGSSPSAIASMMRGKKLPEDYIEKLLTVYECGTRISPVSNNIQQVVSEAIENSASFKSQRTRYFNWVFGDRGLAQQNALMEHFKSPPC